MWLHFTGDHEITGGKDFDVYSQSVLFPPGVTHVNFNISIINDDEEEEDETFQLKILLRQSNKRISDVRHQRVEVTIIDDDRGQ